jgi:hypothetical protein
METARWTLTCINTCEDALGILSRYWLRRSQWTVSLFFSVLLRWALEMYQVSIHKDEHVCTSVPYVEYVLAPPPVPNWVLGNPGHLGPKKFRGLSG